MLHDSSSELDYLTSFFVVFFRCFRREANLTRWPAWVYRNYDEKYLVLKIKQKLETTFLLRMYFGFI